MKFFDFRKRLENQHGMALVSVIVIFFVLIIITSAVVTIVYSDSEFSFADENGKMAYYAARSAIDATEKAILDRINELSDEKGAIASNLRIEINDLNEMLMSGAITEADYNIAFTDIVDSYDVQIDDYRNHYLQFETKVLPLSGNYTHNVTINGFETDSPDFNVTVTPIMSGSDIEAYRLETEATVRGTTVKVAKWMGAVVGGEDSIVVPSLALRDPGKHVFDDAIYSYNDITFGTGGGEANTDVTGSITFEGGLINGENVNVLPSGDPYHQTPRTDPEDIPEPASLLPIDPNTLQDKGSVLPENITASNNGYYSGNVLLNKDYKVDTTAGNVVLKFTYIEIGKDFKFTVSGTNDFYIYILDQVPSGVGIENKKNMNNDDVIDYLLSPPAMPNTYLIIDQPVDQRDASTNIIEFDLGKNKALLDAYIYAPYTSLAFKNKLELNGAIVAGNFAVKNNGIVIYKEPGSNPPITDPEFITNEFAIDISGAREVTYTKGSYWLKN